MGDLEGGLADLDRALEIEPDRIESLFSRALLRRKTGDVDGALADYDRVMARNPGHPRVHAARADARAQKGDWEGALADQDREIELDPLRASAWSARGHLLADRGRWKEAESDFRKALELDPKGQVPARLRLWTVRSLSGSRVEADQELERHLAERPEAAPGDWFTCLAGYLVGRVSEERLIEEALSVQDAPDRPCEARHLAGVRCWVGGRREAALQHWEEGLRRGRAWTTAYRASSAALSRARGGE